VSHFRRVAARQVRHVSSYVLNRNLARRAMTMTMTLRPHQKHVAAAFTRSFSSTTLGMPALSPTMPHGNIVEWKVKEGQAIKPGQILCSIETDKATIDFESVEEGFIAAILKPNNAQNVVVGDPIAIMVEEESEIAAAQDEAKKLMAGGAASSASTPASSPAPASAPASAPSSSSSSSAAPSLSGSMSVVGMPALSPTMPHGNIVEWKIKEGQAIKPGQILCSIETDKATIDFESVEEGFLAGIIKPNGSQNVDIGEPIAIMVEEESELAAAQAEAKKFVSGAAAPTPAPASTAPSASAPTTSSAPAPTASVPSAAIKHHAPISPAVYHTLAEHQIDPASVKATGKGGRLLKGDVLAAIKSGSARKLSAAPSTATAVAPASTSTSTAPTQIATSAPSSSTVGQTVVLNEPSVGRRQRSYTDLPLTTMRKVIATRLTQSKTQVPHQYTSAAVTMDALLKFRSQIKALGANASVNDLVIRAAALALRDVPELNVTFDSKSQQPVSVSGVDISVAVATPSGLITPIIKNADQKRVSQISEEIRELAGRAKDNKLKPHEFQGGSFTISNLGMFGISEFSAVINLPQACILAVSGSQTRVVPKPAVEGQPQQFTSSTSMTVQLSSDARCVDQAATGKWLQAFSEYIENPTLMMM